jgi:hypothetical protein
MYVYITGDAKKILKWIENKNPRVEMLLHSNTLSWLRANQHLILLLKLCEAKTNCIL